MPVSVTLSTSGGTTNLKGTVVLTAVPTAGGQVTGVRFYVDDVLKSTDATAPYNYSWDTTTVQDGPHQLKAQATYAKNQIAEQKLNVTVLNQLSPPPPPPPPPPQGVPVNVTLPTISGTATEGQTLYVSDVAADWTNAPTSYAHQWDRCDAAGANCIDIASARANTYMLSSVDVGATIRCWTTAYNASGPSAPVLSNQTQVIGSLTPAVPSNTSPAVISGNPTVGATLTVSNGGWTNSPTSYGHCWDRCDAAGANCSDIANGQDCTGATPNSSYTVTSADVGSTIRAYTKAYNATGASAAILSAATAVVTSPSPPPPPVGSVLFDGAFETGNTSQWDIIQAVSSSRVVVSTGIDGVTPRQGNYLCRMEVRNGDSIYGGGTDACQVARADNILGHYSVVGDDIYTAFSIYLPNGFQYVPNSLFNNFFNWHGDSSAVQAPAQSQLDTNIGTHYGITNSVPGFTICLHNHSVIPLFEPMMFRWGDAIYGQWVDFVLHTKWSTGSDGKFEGWMKTASQSWGAPKFSYTGQTWYLGGYISKVKPQIGYYRSSYSPTVFVYIDGFKYGTTFAAVAA